MTEVLTKPTFEPSLLWKGLVGVALVLSAGGFVKLGLDAASSPTPLSLLAAEVALFVLLGLIIYIRLGNVDTEQVPERARVGAPRSRVLGLALAYVVSMTMAVWLLRESSYVPSSLYYVTLSLAVAFVGMEVVLWSPVGKRATILILLQVISIGALIQISFAWLNPNSVVADLYFDWLGIEAVLQSGNVPELLGYFFYFPSFHVLNSAMTEVAGAGIGVYLLFNHLLMIVAVPAIFLLAGEIVSHRKALVSALLLLVSSFFFLSAAVLPVLLGASIMLLATYTLLRYEKTRSRRWAAAFWVLAVFVFFSHPVNALIFSVVLAVFWINNRLHRTRPGAFTEPTATYGVAYLGYLIFMAASAFRIFVESLFESGPRYYFARVAPLPGVSVPPIFYAQTLLSTLGFSVLFLLATVALLSWLFKGNPGRRFVLGTVIALVAVPTGIVLLGRGPYGLQAARTLLYISILLVIPAASGLVYLAGRMRGRILRPAMVAIVLFAVATLSSTSYLTGSGSRVLSDSIPIQTTYVTDSMLVVGDFLDRIPTTTPIALDPAMAFFLAPWGSGLTYSVTPYPIAHPSLVAFSTGFGNASVTFVLSDLYLSNSGYEAPDTSSLDAMSVLRVYDNGNVRVYAPLGG